MSFRVFVFEATISKTSGKKLGIYIPKDLEKDLLRYHGEKVFVHVYVREK